MCKVVNSQKVFIVKQYDGKRLFQTMKFYSLERALEALERMVSSVRESPDVCRYSIKLQIKDLRVMKCVWIIVTVAFKVVVE